MDKIFERFDASELIQDAEDQRLMAEFVDADSTDEEMDLIIALVDGGLTSAEIRASLAALRGEVS